MSSTPEIEWDPAEQGWMIALAEYEAQHCEGCGHDLTETLPPASEPEDWAVIPPLRCSVCTRIAQQQDEYAKADTQHLQALRWRVVRKQRRRR